MNYDLFAIIGPTAVGKTKLAVALAADLNGEIISADSRQLYRGMDLGSGKDLEEYVYKGKQIPYHLTGGTSFFASGYGCVIVRDIYTLLFIFYNFRHSKIIFRIKEKN